MSVWVSLSPSMASLAGVSASGGPSTCGRCFSAGHNLCPPCGSSRGPGELAEEDVPMGAPRWLGREAPELEGGSFSQTGRG